MKELIVDEDIRLIPVRLSDTEELFALVDDDRDRLRQWLPWVDGTKQVQDTNQFIQSSIDKNNAKNGYDCGIWFRGQLAGIIGLHGIQRQNRNSSIGYWLHRDQAGQGIMTRATRAMIQHLFEVEKVTRVEITCATENHRSQAIPLRLGARREGIRRQCEWLYDHFVDHVVYSILAEEWAEHKPEQRG
jgi:ribosomal-protein-serine acetyltransferase